jgi:predicted O-methyltransferase YrrM
LLYLRAAGGETALQAVMTRAIPGEFDFVFMDTGAPLDKRLLDLVYARGRAV